MASYSIYRRAASESSFRRINAALIDATSFIDIDESTGLLYYYAVASADQSGDESVLSLSATPAGASFSKEGLVASICSIDSCADQLDPRPKCRLLVFIIIALLLARLRGTKARKN